MPACLLESGRGENALLRLRTGAASLPRHSSRVVGMAKAVKAIGMGEMTRPITVGLFVVGMFFAAWAVVAAVAISSATYSPPEMGADIFGRRSRVEAVPTASRCILEAAAGSPDQLRPLGDGGESTAVAD